MVGSVGRRAGFPWRGGRPPKRYSFTAADVARTAGLDVRWVRQLIRDGKLDPSDLVALSVFVVEHTSSQERRVARAVVAAGGDMGKAAAVLGVARSTLYRRAKRVTSEKP
jgi:transcriptional regulator of acetoin/glycerol metabolism